MALSIFQTPQKPSVADPHAGVVRIIHSDRISRMRVRLRSRDDKQIADITAASFVDPVHGRHCICDRCDRQRAA